MDNLSFVLVAKNDEQQSITQPFEDRNCSGYLNHLRDEPEDIAAGIKLADGTLVKLETEKYLSPAGNTVWKLKSADKSKLESRLFGRVTVIPHGDSVSLGFGIELDPHTKAQAANDEDVKALLG